MRIAIDAFGGDNAPLEIIKGARQAADEYGVNVTLVGMEEAIINCAAKNNISLDGLDIADAPDVLTMHDEPTSILRALKNSSMAVAFKMVADGEADAFVSAGSTGAVVVGGTLIIKRIKGIKRVALGSMIPSLKKPFLMMDIGANADTRPEMLAQYGLMASVYLQEVEGINNPQIALLNIGAEDTKGDELRLSAYSLLKEAPINFVGNIESRDIMKGECDAVITDGFTGNVALKLIEGVTMSFFKLLKGVFYKNILTKLSALTMKKGLTAVKAKADYSEVGGAPLLGCAKPVIKAHGSSDAKAIKNAIHQAIIYTQNNVIEKISAGLEKM
ncbi:MAG: phosphate acyltransferase PlsX [Acutalibacteraceae bacterium]|nr:phosphate acyltransferase PlsX [Acutalibacteraceae bacterium]